MYKKISLILLAVIFTASYAQAQFTFGARAGFNLTNMSAKYDGKKSDDYNPKFKPGFQIGVVGEYAFSDVFAIQPGILFATQGVRFKESEDGVDFKNSTNLNYLQIPINAMYKLDLSSVKLLFQAGPYVGYAISGKEKWSMEGNGIDESGDDKIEFGSDNDKTKALDFGIGLGVGLQFAGNFQAGVGYNLGLMNLSNVDKYTSKNSGIAVTLTYMFGK